MNIAPAAYIVCVDDGSSCLKYYITAASYTILQQHHIVLNLHQNESAGILPLQPMLMPSVRLPRVKPLHLVRIVVANLVRMEVEKLVGLVVIKLAVVDMVDRGKRG